MLEDDIDREKVAAAEQRINEYLEQAVARQDEEDQEDMSKKKRKVTFGGEVNTEDTMPGQGGVSETPSSSSNSNMDDGIATQTQPGASQVESDDLDIQRTVPEERQKRSRDAGEDEEEIRRPTQYQTIEDEDAGDVVMNYIKVKTKEPDDEEGLIRMKESDNMRRNGKYAVVEVFSPPRIAARARERGLSGGWSLDWMHTCPVTGMKWDLSQEHTQKRAMGMLRRDKPKLVVCSPPCTMFSMLQFLTGDPKLRCPVKYAEALKLLNFAVRVCEEQRKAGRLFVFEHPLSATSWKTTELRALMKKEDVYETVVHQCMYGLTTKCGDEEGPAMKPTRFITNSKAIQDKLNLKCDTYIS